MTVIRYVQNVHYWHKCKYASVLAMGQLSDQSATAPNQLINVVNVIVTLYLRLMQNK